MVDKDEFRDTVVEQNNPPGDAAETNDDVFFDALMGLPALDHSVETNNNNAMLTTSLGPLANADDVDTVLTLTGFLAFGVDAPLDLRCFLWPPGQPEQHIEE